MTIALTHHLVQRRRTSAAFAAIRESQACPGANHICAHPHTHTHAHTHTQSHTKTHTHARTHMHVCTHAHTHKWIPVVITRNSLRTKYIMPVQNCHTGQNLSVPHSHSTVSDETTCSYSTTRHWRITRLKFPEMSTSKTHQARSSKIKRIFLCRCILCTIEASEI